MSIKVFAASNTIADGWYYIKNVNAQKYLQVKDSKAKNAQNVNISRGTKANNQNVYVDKLNGSANKIGSVPVRGNGFKTTTSAKDPYSPKTKQDKNTSNLSLTKSFKESNGSLGNNPLITQGFMADPTAVEYNGRLYVYGTEDVIAYDANGNVKNNSYPTHTLKVISSEDLVNLRDEGSIDVKAVTKWANNAWAPSICKKKVNGSYKFFLYFANGANGIGVLTADSPTGPWKSPRSSALVSRSTPGCSGSEVPWLFDPAGLFEDSEINKIGDTYYYSYCTNFSTSSVNKGSIYYMVSKNPMSGWQQKGQLFACDTFIYY